MEKRISVLLAAIVLCGSAAAQSSASNPNPQGHTRAEVRAELACAQASGEYAALNTDHFDPQALEATHARAATTPECLPGVLGRAAPAAVDTPATLAAPSRLQRTRAQVQAEVACARATGELEVINSDHFDPIAVEAAHARAATTPACHNALAESAH
jgi:hypothetical protein